MLYLGKKLDTSMRKYFKGGLKIVNIFAKRKSCHGKFKDGPKTFFTFEVKHDVILLLKPLKQILIVIIFQQEEIDYKGYY